MIISHQHKFIFIKTNKTAGTSIEIGLSQFCGPDDIITPIGDADEMTRKELGYRGPQNYKASIGQHAVRDMAKWLTQGKRKHRFYNHMSAEEVIALIGRDIWDGYYTFCFERNPWDRIISQYSWVHRSEPRPPIEEFIHSEIPKRLKKRGYSNYTIGDEVVVDRVCRYEDLSEELETFRKRVGISEPIELPRAKGQYRNDRRHYRDVLSEADGEYIAELFQDEIRLLDYEW